ncbi:hypothetical protein SDC9_205798 [bioreactor metagenome]|uniref:Uncharacterized protein n=1 Tax=bioreactor metagenome TaxID=1076179 RepID=A0A645J3Y0_9ZZZZ
MAQGNVIERVKGRCIHMVQAPHRQGLRVGLLRLLAAVYHKLMGQQNIALPLINGCGGDNCPQGLVVRIYWRRLRQVPG